MHSNKTEINVFFNHKNLYSHFLGYLFAELKLKKFINRYEMPGELAKIKENSEFTEMI